jgi:hypothetical protein
MFGNLMRRFVDWVVADQSPAWDEFYLELKRNQYEVTNGVVSCGVCGLQYGCGQCGSSHHLERLNETYVKLKRG